MHTREEEIKKNLSILQPHVTAFSAQLLLNHKHQDEVIVGGKVLSVLDANRLDMDFNAPYSETPMPAEDMGVYIRVSDEVGEMILVSFQPAYRRIVSQLDGESLVGKIVIGNGQYAVIDKDMDFVTEAGKLVRVDSHPDKEITPRVFCYGMKLITE